MPMIAAFAEFLLEHLGPYAILDLLVPWAEPQESEDKHSCCCKNAARSCNGIILETKEQEREKQDKHLEEVYPFDQTLPPHIIVKHFAPCTIDHRQMLGVRIPFIHFAYPLFISNKDGRLQLPFDKFSYFCLPLFKESVYVFEFHRKPLKFLLYPCYQSLANSTNCAQQLFTKWAMWCGARNPQKIFRVTAIMAP